MISPLSAEHGTPFCPRPNDCPQFGGEIVAQFLASVPLFITCLGLIGALRWTTGATWPGFFAPVFLFGLGPITLGYAYVDNGLMLYCWATLLATAIFIAHGNSGWRCPWLVIAGFMAGMAMGTKYFGVVFISLPALWLLVVRRDWRATLVYGGTALIFGSWWYIRAWVISGDPVHPFGGNVFGYFLWDAEDLIGQVDDVTRKGLFFGAAAADFGVFALVPLSSSMASSRPWADIDPCRDSLLLRLLGLCNRWIHPISRPD